ncbi:MAG TPA: sulfurtransferase TusA family protein, partial [Planctomycetota bacterium]|nr:sulfurtransferase TusA family protein [Planctomycetota bacterium]
RENFAEGRRPPCLGVEGDEAPRKPRKAVKPMSSPDPSPSPAEEWDAGEMGCGDLVLELRLRLSRLAPGGELRVLARDPGAPEDIPAWCRLTGHALVESKPPLYRIRRKES